MQINRHSFLIILGLLIFTVTFPAINALAQQSQEASLSIVPGAARHRFTPEIVDIGTVFIDKAQTQTETLIYKTLPPGLTEADLTPTNILTQTIPNQYVMEDAQGKEFNVTLNISNLIDGDKVIPFEQISMVTLSNYELGPDSFNDNSPKADIVGISGPLGVDCPGWSETSTNLQSVCPALNTNFFAFDGPVANHSLDPLSDITEIQTEINVDPAKFYNLHEIIEFTNGEKALVTGKAENNTSIEIRRGALGTTATTHTAGSGIKGYGYSSQSVTIMEADEFTDRIGSYSIGFGFLLKIINTTFEPGNYSGTITITLSPETYPSP